MGSLFWGEVVEPIDHGVLGLCGRVDGRLWDSVAGLQEMKYFCEFSFGGLFDRVEKLLSDG